MLHQIRGWILLILISVNGLLSYELIHTKIRATATNNDDEMLKNDEDIARVEENLESNFFQGDILTTPEQKKNIDQVLFHDNHDTKYVDNPDVRGLVKDLRMTWTNGVVNYVIENSLAGRKKMIEDAIEHWKQRTCLKFKERTTESDYVNFQYGLGCSSYVGRIKGKQKLVVGRYCKLGNVIHEIGHAIGFFHEMARPDRDEFVKINWKYIFPSRRRNFLKFSTNVIDSRNIPYDYNSIMHYSRLHFSKDRKRETVVPTKDPTAHIGQRLGLSVLDVKQAKLLYNCGTNLNDNTDSSIMIPNNDKDNGADSDIDAVH